MDFPWCPDGEVVKLLVVAYPSLYAAVCIPLFSFSLSNENTKRNHRVCLILSAALCSVWLLEKNGNAVNCKKVRASGTLETCRLLVIPHCVPAEDPGIPLHNMRKLSSAYTWIKKKREEEALKHLWDVTDPTCGKTSLIWLSNLEWTYCAPRCMERLPLDREPLWFS